MGLVAGVAYSVRRCLVITHTEDWHHSSTIPLTLVRPHGQRPSAEPRSHLPGRPSARAWVAVSPYLLGRLANQEPLCHVAEDGAWSDLTRLALWPPAMGIQSMELSFGLCLYLEPYGRLWPRGSTRPFEVRR